MRSRSSWTLGLATLLLLAACTDAPPVILETALVTDTNDVRGPYEVASIIRDDGEVTGAWIFYSTDGRQNFEPVVMEQVAREAWLGRIPGLPLGTRVDYYVLARDGEANVSTDPSAVPADTHCFQVGAFPSNPRVLMVFPDWGPTTGSTAITVLGQDFRPGARLFLGAAEADAVVVHDETRMTALTPPGEAGLVDITVENPAASELGDAACDRIADDQPVRATLDDGFRYVLPPTPMLVTPDRGPTVGGTTVVITGQGFQEGAQVTFDGAEASGCMVFDAETIQCVTPPGDPGPADVAIENPDGLRGNLPGGFRYVPPPEIFAVVPPRGPDTGDTPVTILGSGFQAGAIVLYDEVVIAQITFVDGGALTGLTLPHPPGFVDVRVRNPDGQEARLPRGYFYFGPPLVESIEPPQGPTIGGQRVVIRGSSFVPGLTVAFDGLPATLVSVTEVEIVVVTPPHAQGPVQVVVTNPDGRTGAGAYTYVPPPFIDNLMPTCGPASGGTMVTLQGRNYQEGAAVLFGAANAAQTTVVSPAVIRATTPAHPAGTVPVKVINPDGGETPAPASFTFVPAPRVSGVEPPTMLLCGGVTITVRGEDFLPGLTVAVGDEPCTDVRLISATEVQCTAPPGSAGPRNITVTNHECVDQSTTSTFELRYEALRIEPRGGLIAGHTGVRILHPLPLGRAVVATSFGGTPALAIANPAGGPPVVQSPGQPPGEVPVEITLEGCAPEIAKPDFRYRVFVDETAARLPHPACNSTATECQANAVVFGDMNGDGLADLVQATGGISDLGTNLLYLNRADQPGFFTATTIPDGAGGRTNTASVDLADVDGDGDLDVLFAGTSGGRLYLNNGQGVLTEGAFSQTLRALRGSFDARFGDVNNDGRPDIVYLEIGLDRTTPTGPQNGPDHVYLNQGGGRFTEVAGAFPTNIFSVHDHKLALDRFTPDANLDLVVVVDTHFDPRPFHRFLSGDGTGHFQTAAAAALRAVEGDVFGIEHGDFDGDGRPDLFLPVEGFVVGGTGACGIRITTRTNVLLLNDGQGGFVDRSDLLPPDDDPTIGSASFDVDNDGDLDLVAVNHGLPTRIYVNDGAGRFHDASSALRDPPVCALSAAGAAIDRTGVPALVAGGNFATRLWVQTHTPP